MNYKKAWKELERMLKKSKDNMECMINKGKFPDECTPQRLKDINTFLEGMKTAKEAGRKKIKKIRCPRCGTKKHITRDPDDMKFRLMHKCDNCEIKWNRKTGRYDPVGPKLELKLGKR